MCRPAPPSGQRSPAHDTVVRPQDAQHRTLLANLIRDAEVHAMTAEISAPRLGPPPAALRDTLVEGPANGPHRRRVAADDGAEDGAAWV